jgi:hypothetical protein
MRTGMPGSHVRRFDDWQKTKIDVVASPFTIDTIPGIFSYPGMACAGNSAGIMRTMVKCHRRNSIRRRL